ncbi:MAG: glycosyltransferase family 4 protein [Elusimicrobia bacterium]|nr:glycosyltransferase family 4 protein [Elusimicrobiota bacterium]
MSAAGLHTGGRGITVAPLFDPWAYRRTRARYLVSRLLGATPAPLYDLAFVVPEPARGWILEAICRETAARFGGKTAFHYAIADPPPARAYFLAHYGLLPKFLKLNTAAWGAKLLVHYTHPRELTVGEEELVYAFNRATRVIAPNSAAVGLLRALGVQERRLAWIPAAADPALFEPHRRGLGAVGFSTAYYERKRPALVLELARRLPQRKFIMLGRRWREWPRFAELSELPNFEYVEAPYSEYPRHYARMDVFVSPGVLEGGPIPLIEAMMCNAAPVASATGFAPDIIRHGDNGFLFDPQAPAERVAELIEQAYRLGADVRRTVEHLSWENYAARLRAMLGVADPVL